MALSDRKPATISRLESVLPVLALIIVLFAAAYFRFVGLMWGDYSYPHPDERFLVWVVADIAPVDGLWSISTRLHLRSTRRTRAQLFVYGDLPVILTRYVTGWLFDEVGWDQVIQTGAVSRRYLTC